jgi:NAD(P)-dependent dehydrogenase (short-subunit alcohol dehydrogenase family)
VAGVGHLHDHGVGAPAAQLLDVGVVDHDALQERTRATPPRSPRSLAEPQLASPRDIAAAVLILASDELRVINAAQIPLDLGATKV